MRRLDALTGIRALAALWVVLFHLSTGLINFGSLTPLFSRGYLGVDLFFLLSGFIISYAHQKDFLNIRKKLLVQFLWMRLARIMPVHWFILSLFLINFLVRVQLVGTHPGDEIHFSFWSFICHTLNIQAWGLTHPLTWNYPAWSVSAEWFAYLLFPWLKVLTVRINSPKLNLLAGAVLWLSFYLTALALGKNGSINWCDAYSLIRVTAEFTTGMLLYNIYKIQLQKPASGTLDGWFGLVLLVCVLGIYTNWSDFIVVPFLAVLIYALSFAGSACRAIFANRPMIYLGEISYSLYMVDAFLTMLYLQLTKLLPALSSLQNIPALFIMVKILVSVACAHCLFTYVEKPSRNYLRDCIHKGFRMPTFFKRKADFKSELEIKAQVESKLSGLIP
ncbi:acyltransferase family protein [Vampirovibrio sp.]|uniref:acyltransferase family protein n=1 Tax=Vampirovibrio sp. TaxID=2717857 RepID=UPI00359411D2